MVPLIPLTNSSKVIAFVSTIDSMMYFPQHHVPQSLNNYEKQNSPQPTPLAPARNVRIASDEHLTVQTGGDTRLM